jgi:hypothetical protein
MPPATVQKMAARKRRFFLGIPGFNCLIKLTDNRLDKVLQENKIQFKNILSNFMIYIVEQLFSAGSSFFHSGWRNSYSCH